MSAIHRLTEKGLIKPPKFLPNNTHYETMMGSVAYGVSSDTSDMDIYGFCIPPKEMVFPHLSGEIPGFGKQIQRFEQYQQHHILDSSAKGGSGQSFDLSIYSIVKYFQLCMENNPNMIDSLFTPTPCVLHITRVGSIVRDSRRMFLHKGCWHKFKGYAYQQVHKMKNKSPESGPRRELIDQYGFDVKFAYHVVRLLDEAEQILSEGDIDLQRNREQLKSIRRGEWTEDDILEYFSRKEKDLEALYLSSSLPHSPDEQRIKQLLIDCLEEHYGDLSHALVQPDAAMKALEEIGAIVERVQKQA